jgi:signal transduction histidine kinase
MRTRTRLLLGFVAAHLVLSLLVGWTVWALIDRTLRDQAEAKVGRVLQEGGFSLSPPVITRMQALTGYHFRLLDAPEPRRPGTVQVEQGGRQVEVDYLTDEHRQLSRTVIAATAAAMVAGVLVFALVAWWLARQFAAPLERLAAAARTIGCGDLQRAVPVSGSEELRQLGLALDQMRGRLGELDRQHRQDERLATLGLFAATIAHEVRNPLSAVQLTVQMQARQRPGDAGLTLIGEELERLDLIVDELLAFSKGMTVTLAPCSLREVVDDVVRLLRRQAEHAGVTVAVEGAARVQADAARLRQLLINLLLNAIQAQHGGGEVLISLQADGFAVADQGPGVDPDLVPRLFAPFSSDKASGTGLGLHLAQAVATAHGARLRYEKRDPGCAFVLEGLECGPPGPPGNGSA